MIADIPGTCHMCGGSIYTGDSIVRSIISGNPVASHAKCHSCIEHLRFREHSWVETHGLDCGPYEHCYEEWWECSECGTCYTEKEAEQLFDQEENDVSK